MDSANNSLSIAAMNESDVISVTLSLKSAGYDNISANVPNLINRIDKYIF